MASSQSVSFNRNLRGYLGSARVGAGRLIRKTQSLSSDPIEPIDAIFSTVTESYDNNLANSPALGQMLASDVLNSLIKMQGEISQFDDYLHDTPSNKATQMYANVRDNFTDDSSVH